jgi:hypothetical protein
VVRSRMRAASNSARAPKTWKTSSPAGVVVSMPSVRAATGLVRPDPHAAGGLEGVGLEMSLLLDRADPGVAEEVSHSVIVSKAADEGWVGRCFWARLLGRPSGAVPTKSVYVSITVVFATVARSPRHRLPPQGRPRLDTGSAPGVVRGPAHGAGRQEGLCAASRHETGTGAVLPFG